MQQFAIKPPTTMLIGGIDGRAMSAGSLAGVVPTGLLQLGKD